jgi:hypothetical protein
MIFRRIVKIVLAISLLGATGGCDAPDWLNKFREHLRAKDCEQAGETEVQLDVCKATDEGYKLIVTSMKQRRQAHKASAFNTAAKALMPRPILESNYEAMSLEVLNAEHHCCSLAYTSHSEAPKHPLFGKRLRVRGELRYHPTDFKTRTESFLSLEKEPDQNTPGYLDVDIESLGREARAFIRANCSDDCLGEFFGTIGPIEKGRQEILGLQIERMELSEVPIKTSE